MTSLHSGEKTKAKSSLIAEIDARDGRGGDRLRRGLRGPDLAGRLTRGVLVSATILAAVILGRVGAGIGGFALLAASGILALAIPTARSLSRRLLIILVTVFGLAPVLWWIPFPLTSFGRATFLLAVTATGLGAWVAFARDPKSRLRRMLPEVRGIDAIPVVVACLSAGTLINFLKTRTASDAMTLLSMNWDNASHFDMYYMLRKYGQIIGALGVSPDGSQWHFYNYPQGFHSTVVLLAEIVRGPQVSDLGGELISYTVLSAVAVTMAVTMVAAALCSIPLFRRRLFVAAPVVIFVCAGWIYGPGAASTMHGFQNFYVAVALVAAFSVLMVLQARVLQPVTLFAASAAAIGVVHNWALLVTLLIGGVVVLVIPWKRSRWAQSKRNYSLAGGIGCFTLLAIAPALGQLSSISTEDVLYAVGGVPAPDYGRAAAVVIGAIAVGIAGIRLPLGSGRSVHHGRRIASSAWIVALGLGVWVFMAVAQIAKSGAMSYYSIKYLLALELVALVVLGMGLVCVIGAGLPGRRRSRWPGAIAMVLAAAASTQVFGLTLDTRSVGLTPSSTSALEFERQRKTLDGPVPAHVEALLAAVESNGGKPAAYLTTYGKEFDAVLAFQWYDALTATYTEKSVSFMPQLIPLWSGVEELPAVVGALKATDPELNIIVDPRDQAQLEKILADR